MKSKANQPPAKSDLDAEALKCLPGVEDFLRAIGVKSNDSSFSALYQRVADFTKSGKDFSEHAPKRWEDPLIETLVRPNDSILDLGCGEGDLLARLSYQHDVVVQGVDRDGGAVIRCIERGMPVCHEDLERFLDALPNQCYTYAVLEQTLQTLHSPLKTLRQMLRVARWCVVSFPNFAHWSVRLAFSLGGRMPVTSSLPYAWHDTPNIHLCSITDFIDWTEEDNINIVKAWALVEGKVLDYVVGGENDYNITADQALFVIERKDFPYQK